MMLRRAGLLSAGFGLLLGCGDEKGENAPSTSGGVSSHDDRGDGDDDEGDLGRGDSKNCPIGSEGCSCTQGGGCDAELSCFSGVCAEKDASGDGDGDGDRSTGGNPGDGDGDLSGGGGALPEHLCGDGKLDFGETCDDGNVVDGDGCSATCVEEKRACAPSVCEEVDGECVLKIPAVYRDFSSSHPDMGFLLDSEVFGRDAGMVEARLDAEGRPVPLDTGKVSALGEWYRDGKNGSVGPFRRELLLFESGDGSFANRYLDDGTRWVTPLGAPSCQPDDNGGEACPVDGNPLFFPLDQIDNPAEEEVYEAEVPHEGYGGFALEDNLYPDHNFHFTSEFSFWFMHDTEQRPELTVIGDDDIWVFVNGILAVDVGNLHPPKGGRLRLGSNEVTIGSSPDHAFKEWEESTRPLSDFELEAGKSYEVKIFHAERATRSSSFLLRLKGFSILPNGCSGT